jgi:hypothetical protein
MGKKSVALMDKKKEKSMDEVWELDLVSKTEKL